MRSLREATGPHGSGRGKTGTRAHSRRRGLLGITAAAVFALSLAAAPGAGADVTYSASGTVGEGLDRATGAAVDQKSGVLYIAELGASTIANPTEISAFDSSGGVLPSFGLGNFAGVAVNPKNQDVYALDTPLFEGTRQILTYDSAGAPVGSPFEVTIASANFPGIASDPAGNVYYPNTADNTVQVFDPDSAEPEVPLQTITCAKCPAPASFNKPYGVGVDDSGNIYVLDKGNERVLEFDSAGDAGATPTVVTSGEVNAVGVNPATGAVFVGEGEAATFHLLGFDSSGAQFADFGLGVFVNPIMPTLMTHAIAVDSTTGKVYIVDAGNEVVRTYTPTLPTAATGAASAITAAKATLAGTVNPKGGPTGCRFEYGTTTAYGSSAPCAAGAGSGSTDVAVEATASGLAASTTYHYRLVAGNGAGSGKGEDATFATLADSCQTNPALCPPTPPAPPTPPVLPGVTTPPPVAPKGPLRCRKGFKKKTVKGKAKCVKVKKKGKKH